MRATSTKTTLLLLALGLVLAAPVSAQLRTQADIDDQIDRVGREFERTQQLLDRVGDMLKDNNSPRVRDLFERAVALQTKGHGLLQHAAGQRTSLSAGSEVREALSLTLRARDIAQRAGMQLREQIGLEERASRTLERGRELLQRLSDSDAASDARVAELLTEARRQLVVARDHFGDRNFEVAMRLGESALKLLEKLADDLRAGGPGVRLANEIERTERLLERARENAASLDDGGQVSLRRAAGLLDDAREAARRGRPGRAIRLLRDCRGLLQGLFDEEGSVGEEDVQRAVARFNAALTRVRELAEGSDDAQVDELIARAVKARDDALQSAEQGDDRRALAQLRAGLDLLGRARRLAGGRR